MLGPKMDLTSPFIEREGTPVPEVGVINSSEEAAEMVEYWSGKGINSFKVYQNITKEDLKAVVETAHAKGKKVTGHICSVTYREAAEIGIDNIEHGFFQSSDFVSDKVDNFCPAFKRGQSLSALPLESPQMKNLMEFLIEKGVAITSTLTVFEPYTGREVVLGGGIDAMSEDLRESLTQRHTRSQGRDSLATVDFIKQMAWERAFYKMGGQLLAGTDPTGAGRTIAGYANQRQIELFIEAGFSLTEAIKIASLDGAKYLERSDKVGSLEVGKQADLVIINGDLEADVANIRKMEVVFKDGIGFDSQKIFKSMKGKVGK
jgi:imidazolonepropionase-like amidohydrolase